MILMAHMTRLAQADEVIPNIGFFRASKDAERFDVMHGKALPDMHATFGAVATLILHDGSAGNKPSPAAIRSRSADPIMSRCAFRLGRPTASNGAELRHAVLLGQPRLLPELPPAMGTRQGKTNLPAVVCLAPDVFGSKCISGPLPSAELVADQVCLWRCVQKHLGLPARSTRRAAKARLSGPVWLNKKPGLACFAGLFDHADSIPKRPSMGKRTTLIACRRVDEAARQPDLFVAPEPAPVQGGLEL